MTDISITYTWDKVDGASYYLLYMSNRTAPRAVFSNEITIDGLTFATVYDARVSAFRRGQEGAQSELLTQKTLLPAPTISRFLFGETYINGTAVDLPSVTNCRIYRKGESTALLTGTVTAGVLRIYVLNNANILAGEQYDIRAIDGSPNSSASQVGMATTITAEKAKITLNPVSSVTGVVSGTTEKSGQVRVTVDGVAKTVLTADATGNYAGNISGIISGSLALVETKVGSIYPSSATYSVPAPVGAPATPTNLAVSAITQTTATLSWTASAGAASYKLYQNGYTTVWKTTTATSYALTGTAGSTWTYQVAATNANGDSLRTEKVTVTYLGG
ncbi:fibronectin type III domain-containing protein [Listeria booriae]|uniref:fibronectin type III domain-containing protein n=1 Tax=Listeria booriae TaxID=1552123 RepID=UPI00162A609B|nr:fibronectin type III domain-containing protein [Listeria booriae]MBC1286886.1 fibronectin type III domain-containing protein [Listeria booriae]